MEAQVDALQNRMKCTPEQKKLLWYKIINLFKILITKENYSKGLKKNYTLK